MRYLWLTFLALVVAGCMPTADVARERQSVEAYSAIVAGDAAALQAVVTERTRPEVTEDLVAQMQAQVPEGPTPEPRSIAWSFRNGAGYAAYELRQEYAYDDGVVQWSTMMVREGQGPWQVDAVHIAPISRAEAELSRFSLIGKPVLSYVALVGAVASALLCLFTAGLAGWRRRWGWMIGCLFGFGQLTVNWATGAAQFEIARVALFGAGFVKGAGSADPWFLSFALPIPAIMFLMLRRWRPKPPKRRKSSGYPPTRQDPPPSAAATGSPADQA